MQSPINFNYDNNENHNGYTFCPTNIFLVHLVFVSRLHQIMVVVTHGSVFRGSQNTRD